MAYICEKADQCIMADGDNPCILSLPHEYQTLNSFCSNIGINVSDVFTEKGES